jgi:Mg-chelatase subunit ChlD
MLSRGARREPGGRRRDGHAASIITEDDAELADASTERAAGELEAQVRAAALHIARRLSIPRARRNSGGTRRTGPLQPVPYDGGQDDIDLDRTLEARSQHPNDGEIIMRERSRSNRSVILAVDLSGSMRGERARTAAATVGALAGEMADDHLAVLAFWSDAAWVAPLGPTKSAERLIDVLLSIPARGLTNVGFPLALATRALAGTRARDARMVLLSDCVHNAGPDPRPFAARLPRLDVLLDVSGEHDLELGRELAQLGRGRINAIHGYRDVAPALTRAFAP